MPREKERLKTKMHFLALRRDSEVGATWRLCLALACLVLARKFKCASSDEADNVSGLKHADEDVDEAYDPLRGSERPKIFVDYVKGPLKGKTEKPFHNTFLST